MKKSCPYCGRIHDTGYECPKKPVYGRHTGEAGDLRRTNAWKNKSIEIRKRDHFTCRVCLYNGTLTTKNLSVHHIIPINEDKSLYLDNDNLITLCIDCHERAEQGSIERDFLIELAATEVNISPGGSKAKK